MNIITERRAQDTAPYEHERRFVPNITTLPFDYEKFPMKSILQGYLEDELKTRIRDEATSTGHTYLQTRKTGQGISRLEDEQEITKEKFDTMWDDVVCSLNKSRYFIDWDGINAEVNIFHGPLQGYVQIEIEFDSHEAATAFIPPAWFGEEVTDDNAHGNRSLAKYGLPKM